MKTDIEKAIKALCLYNNRQNLKLFTLLSIQIKGIGQILLFAHSLSYCEFSMIQIELHGGPMLKTGGRRIVAIWSLWSPWRHNTWHWAQDGCFLITTIRVWSLISIRHTVGLKPRVLDSASYGMIQLPWNTIKIH